jgi:hypothetical protein
LLGTIPKKSLPSSSKADRQAVVQLDFSQMDRKKCKDSDFENWYARKLDGHPDCLMGHKVYNFCLAFAFMPKFEVFF